MSTVAKVFVVLNLILSIAFVSWAAALLAKGDDWKRMHETLQAEFDQVKADLEKQIEEKNAKIKEQGDVILNLRDDNEILRVDKESLTQQNGRLEEKNSQLEASVEGIRATMSGYKDLQEQLRTRNSELEDRIDRLQTTTAQAQDAEEAAKQEVARLQDQVNDQEENLKGLREQVVALTSERDHLQNIVAVALQRGINVVDIASTPPKIDGLVTDMNDEFQYVMLNVGSNDNVQRGYRFDIYRGGTYLGRAEVQDVFPDACWARIVFVADGKQIRKGDMASTRI